MQVSSYVKYVKGSVSLSFSVKVAGVLFLLSSFGCLSHQTLRQTAGHARSLLTEVVETQLSSTLSETSADWNEFVNQVRQKALQFTDDLPNFICVQTTRRYFDATGANGWRLGDIVEAELTFNERREGYSKIQVNGKPSSKRFESLGGTLSVGEFGSILRAAFLPEVQATFRREREESFKGGRAVVMAFSVPQATSQWTLSLKNSFSLKVKYQGRIWVDPATRHVLRISQRADLPAKVPITYAEATTEFGMTAIQGLDSPQYLLPLSADVIVQEAEGHYATRNRIEFRNFRRFTAEVTFQEQ